MIDWELVQKLAHIQCTQAERNGGRRVGRYAAQSRRIFEVYKRGEKGKKEPALQFESATKGNVVTQICSGNSTVSGIISISAATPKSRSGPTTASWTMRNWPSMRA